MSSTDRLRVTQIRVNKLFNLYTHIVDLKLTDRVTIIHGPNGIGKTVLLRLVAAMLSGRLWDLVKVPFDVFTVVLSDGSEVSFDKRLDQDTSLLHGQLVYRAPNANEIFVPITREAVDFMTLAIRIDKEVPWLVRLDEHHWADRRTEEILTAEEVVQRHAENIPQALRKQQLLEVPDWLINIRNRVNVHLIETQRLLKPELQTEWRSRPHLVTTVRQYAKDLQSRISQTLADYAKQSQLLDQSFPQRLLKKSIATLDVESLKIRMRDLQEKRHQLRTIGLIDEDTADPFDIQTLDTLDASDANMMTLYVDDTAKKLGVLDDFAKRAELLLKTVDGKFRHKSILIDREQGLTAIGDKKEKLALEDLSSGEQHELVLLYDLLLRVKQDTLVLIDEPELSLHVTWQKSFLPDLLEIVATANFDVLLATHSPFIVGDRSDLMIPLSDE